MTAEPDLLPCPFCGGRAKTKLPYVRCVACGGQMCFGDTNESDSAIAAWNRRDTAARDAEVEALRARLATAYRVKAECNDEANRQRDRAERLAEALRDMLDEYGQLHAKFDLGECQATVDARAALEQENGDA